MSSSLAKYSFLPWFRKGLSRHLRTPSGSRATIKIDFTINSDLDASQTIQLKGPQDILNLNPRSIIKTEPKNETSNFEYNYLPYVEFYDEDFPWRYTPLPNPENNKLKPWLMLLVLKDIEGDEEDKEFSFNPINHKSKTQSIKVLRAEPLKFDPARLWATAHVHINGELNTNSTNPSVAIDDLSTMLEDDPDIAYSRIFSFRKLEPNTKYCAFLVPSFERGRIIGLHYQDDDIDDLINQAGYDDPSWDFTVENEDANGKVIEIDHDFPYYKMFKFSCSESGDFESLARKLTPVAANDILKQPEMSIKSLNDLVDINTDDNPKPTQKVDFIGAYQAPNFELEPWPKDDKLTDILISSKLKEEINKNKIHLASANNLEDPIVNIPPFYGQGHTRVKQLDQSSAHIPWLEELNMHPTYRAVAGIGKKVVQIDQEKFMDEVWGQLGEILEANELLRKTQLSIEVNKKILKKHFVSRPQEIIQNTERLHSRIKAQGSSISKQSLKTHMLNKTLTKSAFDVRMRKMLNPKSSFSRRLNSPIRNAEMVEKLNDKNLPNVSGSKPVQKIYDNVSSINFDPQSTQLKVKEIVHLENLNETKVMEVQSQEVDISATSATILTKLHPLMTLGNRTLRKIDLGKDHQNSTSSNRISPILHSPKIKNPMYEYLKNLSSDFIIPGLSGVKNNSVFIMEPNRKFIESYMAGLNSEMAKELIWRDFPTDGRATVFNKFWNTEDYIIDIENSNPTGENDSIPDDINDLHTWNNQLGGNKPHQNTPGLVVVFRCDLLNKFPNTIIYAQKAIANPNTSQDDSSDSDYTGRLLAPETNANLKFPIFKTQIAPDITIVGFELTPGQAKGKIEEHDDEGWFFILQERHGEPRFGLDNVVDGSNTAVSSWNDLTWEDVTSITDQFLDLDTNNPQNLNGGDGLTFGTGGDSAQMASILYQLPVKLGIHASDLLSEDN